MTHRTQFTAVPWLRAHFLSRGAGVRGRLPRQRDDLAERLRAGVGALADAVRNPESRASMLDMVQTPAQRAVLDRLTAVMTLLEGHAEFVMDGVGPEVIPSVASRSGRKFNRRREAANPVEKLLRRLLGVEIKLRQYAEGRKLRARRGGPGRHGRLQPGLRARRRPCPGCPSSPIRTPGSPGCTARSAA